MPYRISYSASTTNRRLCREGGGRVVKIELLTHHSVEIPSGDVNVSKKLPPSSPHHARPISGST